MAALPKLTGEGIAGLVFSVILSLDKRNIIKRDEFVSDLGEVVGMLRQTDFVSPNVADELQAVHEWLSGRQRPLN